MLARAERVDREERATAAAASRRGPVGEARLTRVQAKKRKEDRASPKEERRREEEKRGERAREGGTHPNTAARSPTCGANLNTKPSKKKQENPSHSQSPRLKPSKHKTLR